MKSFVQEKNGYRIVRRGDIKDNSSPIACPLCECVVIDELDSISISRTGCCFDCENEIADVNRKSWMDGWRPDRDKLNEIISKRLSSPHSRRHI